MVKNYIEWVGTGSGLNPALGNTSFMINGSGRNLLVDCGFTVPQELIKYGQIGSVTDVVVTHPHADHIGGLESLAFMNYFALKNRGVKRPKLHITTEEFAEKLWENSLKGGLIHGSDEDGKYMEAELDTYFDVKIGKEINIPGIAPLSLFQTPHVENMESYGIRIGDKMYYSGDTTALPPETPGLIFQDCQFFDGKGDVHVSYERLKRELSKETKAKTHLVHLGGGWEKKYPKADGFVGFVMPKDRFEIEI